MTTPRKTVPNAKCQVCRHPERHRIEALRLAGTTAEVLVERFGLGGRDSVYRHMDRHVSADTRAAIIADVPVADLAKRAVEESMSLLDYLSLVRRTVIGQMLGAAAINDGSNTAKLAGRAVEVLQEIGRLTGELMASPSIVSITNNNYTAIAASPAFTAIVNMLATRLAPHPEALQAVFAGLDELDAAQTPHNGAVSGLPMLEGSIAA